jgi:proline racemase
VAGSAAPAQRIATADFHTAGEPFRIVFELPVPIPGTTTAERRAQAIQDPDVQARSPGRRSRLPTGTVRKHDSIIGSTRTGTALDTVDDDGRRTVVPQVTGMAHLTGDPLFTIDPYDPLPPGFVLR